MRRTHTLLVGVALAIAMTALTASAQTTFDVGVGAGVGFPTGDLADDDVNTGFGFDLHAVANVTPMIGVYGRYSRYSFGADDTGDVDVDVIDRGFGAGVQLNIPMEGAGIAPWLQGGLIYDVLEIEGSEGGVSASVETDRKLGWEVGAGLALGLGETGALRLQPMLRYRTFPIELENEDGGDMNYVSLSLAVLYRIGG